MEERAYRLYELSRRRELLESRTQIHTSSIMEYQKVQQKTRERLQVSISKQNELAKVRNATLLGELNYDMGERDREERQISISTSSQRALMTEKARFMKKAQAALPMYEKYQSLKLEAKIRDIQRETAESLRHTERLQQERDRSRELMVSVESQRRELLMALAVQEKEKVAIRAQELLFAAESRHADSQIWTEVSMQIIMS
jgi:hypothetical protein